MSEFSDAESLTQSLLPLMPILVVLVTGLFCIVRFFSEGTSQRMKRLAGENRKRSVTIDIGNDPHGLGRMMECTGRNIGPMLSSSGGSDTSSDCGSGCGDGGSGE